jgi:phosphoglucosamine mutase
MSDHTKSGDGLLTAIKIISLLKKSGKKASEFLRPFSIIPYKIKNLKKINNYILETESVKNSLKKIHLDLKNKHNGRLLVRPSGTEPIVRILVECEYNDKIDQYISKVQDLLVKENSSE